MGKWRNLPLGGIVDLHQQQTAKLSSCRSPHWRWFLDMGRLPQKRKTRACPEGRRFRLQQRPLKINFCKVIWVLLKGEAVQSIWKFLQIFKIICDSRRLSWSTKRATEQKVTKQARDENKYDCWRFILKPLIIVGICCWLALFSDFFNPESCYSTCITIEAIVGG